MKITFIYSYNRHHNNVCNIISIFALLTIYSNLHASAINVTSYGAVGDGVTDNTTAINAAISAVNTAPGGSIYFPAGNYYYSGQLNAITKPCTIYGDVAAPVMSGVSAVGSNLNSGGGYGIVFNYSGGATRLTATVHDLSLNCVASYSNTHTGISYAPSTSTTDLSPCYSFRRITFTGWGTAIYFKNLLPAIEVSAGPIEDCEILGQAGNSSPTSIGINIQGATGAFVRHCSGQWLNTFLLIGGNSEGAIVDGCQVAACYKGITLDGVTGNPSYRSDHTITNNFINATTIGLDIIGYIPFCIIANNVFSGGDSAQPISVSDTSGVRENMLISGNSLFGPTWAAGITLDAIGITMTGCQIQGKPIHLTTRASHITIKNNTYTNMDPGNYVVNDNGSAVGLHVGDAITSNGIINVPSGAGTSYTVTVDISAGGYTSAGIHGLLGGTCQCTSDSSIVIRFNWDVATAKTAQLIMSRIDGGSLSPGLYRYNLVTASF